ncbi:protein of unassigned function [Methylobacterium oryzae CBMB20]|uniref:Protein of unassigned function n=1 Tax=Methylobacterium oryzae CBMB20 TaxID=693986 RepID=A0A089NQD0_9HYPH|nr:protein of unassigned function [Methylobacterium oryzae CBMB20]
MPKAGAGCVSRVRGAGQNRLRREDDDGAFDRKADDRRVAPEWGDRWTAAAHARCVTAQTEEPVRRPQRADGADTFRDDLGQWRASIRCRKLNTARYWALIAFESMV